MKKIIIFIIMISGLYAGSPSQATVIPLQSWSLTVSLITTDATVYSAVAGGDLTNNFTSSATAQTIANNLNVNPWINESCDYYDSSTGQLYDLFNPVGSEVYACSRSQVVQYAVEEQTGADGTPFYIVKRYNQTFIASGSETDPSCPMTSYCTGSTDLGDAVPKYKNNYTAQNCLGTTLDYFILSDSLCTVEPLPTPTAPTTTTPTTDPTTSTTDPTTSTTDPTTSTTDPTTSTTDPTTSTTSTAGTELATEVSIKNPEGATDGTTPDAFNTTVSGYEKTLTDKVTEYLNGYVLLDIPLSASGTCSEASSTATILGRSYNINSQPFLAKLDEQNNFIKSLLLFISAFGAVLMVFSGKAD